MKDKKQSRLRRALRSRVKIRELGVVRLTIHRTPRHMYAQVHLTLPVLAAGSFSAGIKNGLATRTRTHLINS